ncbi:MAG: CapA family protein [Anaerolineae bacterium]|nr:CapA family protein [Anaerolineae bacterium]
MRRNMPPSRCGRPVVLLLILLQLACRSEEPRWPVKVGCDPGVPARACARLQAIVHADAQNFAWTSDPATAGVRLTVGRGNEGVAVGSWTYAVAAPFRTAEDEVSSADLLATWRGVPSGPFLDHPLLVTQDTVSALSALWDPPASEAVGVVDQAELLARAEEAGGWAIVPFDELEMGWKVLWLDGLSPVEKGLPDEYPLRVPLKLAGERWDVLPSPAEAQDALSNRLESRMTILAMTGVTALVRTTAQVMETRGLVYPARDIRDWLATADLTHISNEVAFTPDCPVPPIQDTMRFCSHSRYIELLEAVGTDVVELTGNHFLDYGPEPMRQMLTMFQQRGWRWYGGGMDLAEATRPLLIEHGPNRLAFVGCNRVGPTYDWATDTSPGSAPCDLQQLAAQVQALRAEGYLPIATFQHVETYQYLPTPEQVAEFRALASAGAAVVLGSQAHQPQAIEFYDGAFIHYGLGNLFFDQMQTVGTRQEFVDRLIFYDGRLLSIDLRTAMLEDYARPRPMTPEERGAFLKMILELRP